MMSAKFATTEPLKLNMFRNKCYDVVIRDYDVINRILSRESNYIVDEVMWLKFGILELYERKG